MIRGLLKLVLGVWLLTGCTSEDPAPIFLDMDYQVRCIDCVPLAPDDPTRSIRQLSGEEGHTVECRVRHRDGDRFVTFLSDFTDEEASHDDYSLEIRDANIDKTNPGDTCQVLVREGSNTYEGDCTGGKPDGDASCQLSFEVEGDVLMGSILCLGIVNQGNKSSWRRVVRPASVDEPATFEIHGCTGL